MEVTYEFDNLEIDIPKVKYEWQKVSRTNEGLEFNILKLAGA